MQTRFPPYIGLADIGFLRMAFLGDSIRRDRARLIHSMHRPELADDALVWTRAQGGWLWDEQGRRYFDGLSGLWNVLVGHGRESIAEAARRQMESLAFASSYSGGTHPGAIELAERLAEFCYPSIQRFFFASGGSEANESAIKTARYFWRRRGFLDKTQVLTVARGYHGTTLACTAAMGADPQTAVFDPAVAGFHMLPPFPAWPGRFVDGRAKLPEGEEGARLAATVDLQTAIERIGRERIAALLVEPIQAAGGTHFQSAEAWRQVRKICDENRILLIADEVVTGFGRCGDWFGLTRHGVQPDIVTLAKGITSGYFPFGAMGVSGEVAEAIDGGRPEAFWAHGYTNSAHPVGCAVAVENLRILKDESLVDRARELGEILARGLSALASHPRVGQIRAHGLLAAIDLARDGEPGIEAAGRVGGAMLDALRRRGVFTRARGSTIHLAPCFVTTADEMRWLVDQVGECLEDVESWGNGW